MTIWVSVKKYVLFRGKMMTEVIVMIKQAPIFPLIFLQNAQLSDLKNIIVKVQPSRVNIR